MKAMNGTLLKCILIITMSAFSANGFAKTQKAYFAGGCFWCMEPPFEKKEGVIEVYSGYIDGKKANPTYKLVSSGASEYTEAVEVVYDSSKISYKELLEIFWRQVDPTRSNGQFVDSGRQYRPGIYTVGKEQMRLAQESKKIIAKSKIFDKEITLEIKEATKFYPAEEYHQNYYKKNPVRYKFYRYGSGRDQFLKKVWGKKGDFRIFNVDKKSK